MEVVIKDIIDKFAVDGEFIGIEENDSGNINKTYIFSIEKDGKVKKYILQNINTFVFTDPDILMDNIDKVTRHIKAKRDIRKQQVLSVIKTKDDNLYYKDDDNSCYRVYNYVDDAVCYNKSDNTDVFYNAGKGFGHFAYLLNDFPIDSIKETIPDFHNTKKRFMKFLDDVKKDRVGRACEVRQEINFILDHSDDYSLIVDLIDTGKIPLRVIHNDTKINNVLMNKDTNEAMCVIDLDTIMPGSLLYDYGDAIRSGANNTYEDDKNLDNVFLNMDMFKAFTNGYLSEVSSVLTEEEIRNLAFSCKLISLELGMRFLGDYINGDVYFKTKYETHNLDRARNQLKLASSIENNYSTMEQIIDDSVKIYKK